MTPLWLALVIAAVGSYLLKLAGMSLPESILNHPKVQRVAQFLLLRCCQRWWLLSFSTAAVATWWTGALWPELPLRSSPCCCGAVSSWCSWSRLR